MDNVILVLKSKPWKFTDENTGEVKEGVKVTYIDPTVCTNDNFNGFGYSVFECSIQQFDLVEVPAYYKADFITYVKNGNRCTKLSSLEFVANAKLFG